MNIKSLFSNIRFYILVFSFILSLGIYLWISSTIPNTALQSIKLTQYYALIAITYLYIAIIATPITKLFTFFPYRGTYIKTRRAIGVSAFYFGLLHGLLAFFGQLGGFEGLGFLTPKYLIAISISFIGLVILTLMAATSFDYMIEKLTFQRWKFLHRFVYLAGILILIHALMLGSHFADMSQIIPLIVFSAVFILLFLEGIRFDMYLQTKFPSTPKYGIFMVLLALALGAMAFYFFVPNNAFPQLGIHATHIQLAKDIQTGNTNNQNSNLPNIPGLDGDRTKRYTVNFDYPDPIAPNQEVKLNFGVSDASSGNKTTLYKKINSKVAHLIIVSSDLKFFDHVHPDQTETGFVINYKFPKSDIYHLYLDFQPFGAIEQQIAHTLNVGNIEKPTLSTAVADTNLTKNFGNYQVTLQYPKPLQSSQISIGEQTFSFTIKDANNQSPINTLKPYLDSFGHLVMINQSTFDYIHVHPKDLTIPQPNQNGGPTIEFMPIGIYGTIKPGIYRIFAQFNPDNQLFTSDFTVEIK